jgi:hypothetical protein
MCNQQPPHSPIHYDHLGIGIVWLFLAMYWWSLNVGRAPWTLEGTPVCSGNKLLLPYDGGMDKTMLLLILGLTGLTLIIVRAAIFFRFRAWLLERRPNDLGYLFTCPQCMGFWMGLFGGLIYADFLTVPLYAGAVSLLAMLADRLVLLLTELQGE